MLPERKEHFSTTTVETKRGPVERWSLFVDESGDFSDNDDEVVVAGLLVSDVRHSRLERRLRHALDRAPDVPWPVHAWLTRRPIMFALWPVLRAREDLRQVHPLVADHVCRSATRWLVAGFDAQGRRDEGADLVGLMREAERQPSTAGKTARRYLALIDLDRAVTAGDDEAAQAALLRLRELQPGPVGQLERAAERAGVSAASYVAHGFRTDMTHDLFRPTRIANRAGR